jgi:hypothetical protein
MSLRERTRPRLGIIEPCLPSPAKTTPSGPGWLHEIKHDGFRILARRDNTGVWLITRAGNDFSSRFPCVGRFGSKADIGERCPLPESRHQTSFHARSIVWQLAIFVAIRCASSLLMPINLP